MASSVSLGALKDGLICKFKSFKKMASSVLFGYASFPNLLNSSILKMLEQFEALDTLFESYMDNLFAKVDATLNTEKLKEALYLT